MNVAEMEIPVKPPRKFLPENLVIDKWETLQPFYENLKNRTIASWSDFRKWMRDRNELEAVMQEDSSWRYIRMSCDTTDKTAREAFNFFVTEIHPKSVVYDNDLNKRLLAMAAPYLNELQKHEAFFIYLRQIKKQVEIYRDENIPLLTKLQIKEQKYAEIIAEMTVFVNGKEITLSQASSFLRDNDRTVREDIFNKISTRRLQDKIVLDELYTELVRMRHQVALNAGFENFRDYSFAAMGRFDYTAEDCFNFHNVIKETVVPFVEEMEQNRKAALNLDKLKPWDTEVNIYRKHVLTPFTSGNDLIDKTIQCFHNIHPYLGERMEIMKFMKHLDLESRKGKAPGGFNFSLHETGIPFVFMNATNSLRDLVTMVHEGGHAVHSFLTKDLELVEFRETPSEVAELASMSMELISMEHWEVFFNNEDDWKRAKRHQLQKVLDLLPWIATIDKFQHWIYTHPEHAAAERTQAWEAIYGEFVGDVINWDSQEEIFDTLWQKQLHLYEVPFYYIEYGMAQLGAIAVWRNYKQNPDKALKDYIAALKLGYTKPIGEIYKTAGIKFDFSKAYIQELVQFVKDELKKI